MVRRLCYINLSGRQRDPRHFITLYPYEIWVPNLAVAGKAKGTYFKVRTAADQARVKPGYLFLVPGGTNYWSHVGIVESVQSAAFLTVEGNSGPSPNAVTRQSRALIGYDFLIV